MRSPTTMESQSAVHCTPQMSNILSLVIGMELSRYQPLTPWITCNNSRVIITKKIFSVQNVV